MYHLHHRIGIAVSGLTLAIVSSYPVLAKPQVRAKVNMLSQVSNQAVVIDNMSRQPVDAILANVRLKSSIQSNVGRTPRQPVVKSRSITRIVTVNRHLNADRVSQGVANFTNHRINSRSNHPNAIDRWID